VSSKRQETRPGRAWRPGMVLPHTVGAQWLPWARGVQEGCGGTIQGGSGAISKTNTSSRLAEWSVRAACSGGVALEVLVRGATSQRHDVHAVPQQRCLGGPAPRCGRLVAAPRHDGQRHGPDAVPGQASQPLGGGLFLDCRLILGKKRGVFAKWKMFA
jgi:hypothetical protein